MQTTLPLSDLILQTRRQQGLSREELASLAQVSTSFIRDAEKDADTCSFGKLMRLLQALGLRWAVTGQPTPTASLSALANGTQA